MNIEEYRAMKMQEEQEKQQASAQGAEGDVQAQQGDVTATEQVAPPQTQENPASGETGTQAETSAPTSQTAPEYVEVDGKQVPVDELKGGYLRQSDYTRKTQEIAKEKERLALAEKYFEAVNSRPEFAKELAESFGLPYMSPEDKRFEDLKLANEQLRLDMEIRDLSAKYPDFDANRAVELSLQKGYASLEDAYLIEKARTPQTQASVDVAAITEQIRQQVMSELKLNVDTSTIIATGGNDSSITQTAPELSAQELRVAQGLKMTKEEYIAFKGKK